MVAAALKKNNAICHSPTPLIDDDKISDKDNDRVKTMNYDT